MSYICCVPCTAGVSRCYKVLVLFTYELHLFCAVGCLGDFAYDMDTVRLSNLAL